MPAQSHPELEVSLCHAVPESAECPETGRSQEHRAKVRKEKSENVNLRQAGASVWVSMLGPASSTWASSVNLGRVND